MVRPREFDEQEALIAAMNVFWEKGYEAASLSDLTSRMGIRRPSLYAAFGGKKELFEAALSKYSELSLSFIQNRMRNTPTVKEAFRVYLYGIVDGAGENNPDFGCLCVNTMVELAPHDETFAAFTKDFQTKTIDIFEQTIADGIRKGELSSTLNASSLAHAMMVSSIGLSVARKSKPDRAYIANAVEEILKLLY
ncbi:TetR/AcrR family transcriptional regulator [Paenibacillus sp. YIM B09110]|uniref:TetR/AcrR family transcriptional regulator n=1 Tax=Paenibacillus sp. YIM B09110 TaxID=3126102 RepID=UPI00301B8082